MLAAEAITERNNGIDFPRAEEHKSGVKGPTCDPAQ